jgi:hypothetical protein
MCCTIGVSDKFVLLQNSITEAANGWVVTSFIPIGKKPVPMSEASGTGCV